MSDKNKGNRLVDSSSPYLLQHAYNPVEWQPWDEQSLQQAREEDKPILVSIGYSACHWCHVMEHQSFENEAIAQTMNEHFVCIKIDREERPDIDQIYMDAVQAMGVQGGWPLNVFLTPEQKPFYGGTYFPPAGWQQLLEGVANAFASNREKLEESATNFTKHLNVSEASKYNIGEGQIAFDNTIFTKMVDLLESKFDYIWGGIEKEPKFPMPSIWLFLLEVYDTFKLEKAGEMAFLTLQKMFYGGIYDHVGGGFARYSVDRVWHIPHFEKMLYDNGQLLSLYAKALSIRKEDWIEKSIFQTISWLKDEMTSPEGGFYSALDADSEGEEGKYYCWSYGEFKAIAGKNHRVLADYYDVKKEGNWEDGKNNLRLLYSPLQIAEKHGLSLEDLKKIVNEFGSEALEIRKKRIAPGLDDKILTSWNGLMLKGLIDVYKVSHQEEIKTLAIKNGNFILEKLKNGDRLYRTYKEGKASLDGYLEDYAWVINAFFELYQITLDFTWLKEAKALTDYTVSNFYDKEDHFFYFTDDNATSLIARKKEVFDNVIPSSNAAMALNLHKIGHVFDHQPYQEMALEMVNQMSRLIANEPEYLSYWGSAILQVNTPFTEVVISGNLDLSAIDNIYQGHLKQVLLLKADEETTSLLPLTQNKPPVNEKTTYYVCHNKTCQLPVTTISEMIDQVNTIHA